LTDPAAPSGPLTPAQAQRYARQLSLPGVGAEGQQRLLRSSVALVGVGGLGSPLAAYLAAAGVGRLVLVDGDRVDPSNLHRQVLYGTRDVGRPKVEVARERILAVNPDARVEVHEVRLDASNAKAILSGVDCVADGSDNFPARYLVNDACVLLGIPNAYGSIFRYEGQVSFFDRKRGGPCYRCLHPEPPPPGLVPSCAEAGVLGVLPGVVGCLQATEVVKHLLGAGDLLVGRLLVYDALALAFRELRLKRDPACAACGDAPTIRELRDLEGYGEACAAPASPPASADAETPAVLGPEEVRDRLAGASPPVLVDVRDDWEVALGTLPGAVHIPLPELPGRWRELPRDREVVVYCHAGVRSARAAYWLRTQGMRRVASLDGGTDAWSAVVDPTLPRY
jgi:adenylyltransferase/sulfurtransferase